MALPNLIGHRHQAFGKRILGHADFLGSAKRAGDGATVRGARASRDVPYAASFGRGEG